MAKYINVSERVYEIDDIVGNKMERCELWNDGNVSARIVPMPAGTDIGYHRHETWVQVFVLSGRVKVLPDGRTMEEGGYYFVEPGDVHCEIAEVESVVLVIKDEPNKQYPVSKSEA